jgi:PTH1 family peptidyl-tRNA hydrolase
MLEEELRSPTNDDRFLIAGLGNPGSRYRDNRHNIGFMVVDRLSERTDIEIGRLQKKALVGTGWFVQKRIILVKPQTNMNLSGTSLGPLINYYKIPLPNLLVVYDEIDLPFGAIRLRERGGSGGHNGMKSIIAVLGSGFPRLRLGVGRPPGKMEPAAYVLQDFQKEELPVVEEIIERSVSAIETYLIDGIDIAMTRFNNSSS